MLAVAVVASLAGSVFASDGLDLNAFDSIKDTSNASTSVTRIIGALINIIQIIGSGVAIIMLIVLAIKYISAAPGDKADIKKHAVVYVVGAIVLFAATGILQIIKNFSENVRNS
ncbi:MAG: pilin [Clostridia bacterium]